jgi:pyruvate/2-oxoglutarate dehydrogenase complex dihydrolipoamide acyltransferase (E2) component
VRRHMVHALLELDVTLAHDLVDGAPAARFARRLRELVEQAEVLRDRREG